MARAAGVSLLAWHMRLKHCSPGVTSAGPGREARRRAWAVAVPAPPRWRASARAAGGWRDLPAETLSTLACAGSTVVVRGW